MRPKREDRSRSGSPAKSDKSAKSRSRSPRRSSSSMGSESDRSRSRSRSRSPSNSEGYRLHIGDIGDGVSKADLVDIFKKFGTLKEFWMANSPPCFGFAVFKRKRDAKEALNGCDGLTVYGSRIRVSMARPRTRGHGRRGFGPGMRCYHCGNSGHFYRDCSEKYDNRYGGSRSGGGGGGGGGRDYRPGGKSDRYSSRDSRGDYSSRDRRERDDRDHRSSRRRY